MSALRVLPTAEELRRIADAHGIEELGVCSAAVFGETRVALHARKAAGLSADMQFTYRNPERSTDVGLSLDGARTIVVGALSYRRTSSPGEGTGPVARVGEYVWEPYYERLRIGLDAIGDRLRADGWRSRTLVDDNALVDRAAAHRAGIGWFGKNSNLLVPGKGSRFVLGSVVTDAPLTLNNDVVSDGCGPCRRCIDSCPTDAIVADGVIDSTRCLAWLVQSDGVFPRRYRRALGDRIYGCDDCQTSCPPNVAYDRNSPPSRTAGRSGVAVHRMLSLDDDTLMSEFGSWYVPRRQARYLRRNALVVLANVGSATDPVTRELVADHAESPDEIVRVHAIWAAHELGFSDLVGAASGDRSALVQAELEACRRP